MRLTLRTMLAYIDNILAPEDAEELRTRIENSEFAGSLMRRIESTARRLRLDTPAVDAKGMGADANTVAEYLDNTLPPERVPDFERVCLESDVHLAEVTACHQVLAQVLGKRIEISAEVRQRAFSVIQQASEAAPASMESGRQMSGVASTSGGASPARTRAKRLWRRGEAPVKEGDVRRRRQVSLAVGALIVLLLASAVWVAVGPWPTRVPLGQGGPVDVQPSEAALAAGPTYDEPVPSDVAHEATRNSVAPEPQSARVERTGEAEGVIDAAVSSRLAGNDSPASPSPLPVDSANGDSSGSATQAAAAAASSAVAGVRLHNPLATEVPETRVESERGEVSEVDAAEPSVESLLPTTARISVQLMTADELMLYATDTGGWQRATLSHAIPSGAKLLSSSVFRPQVELNDGMRVTSVRSSWRPLAVDNGHATAGIAIDYGRFLLENQSPTPSYLQVQWGNRLVELRFSANGGQAALEIEPLRLPGDDPLSIRPHLLVRLVILNGIVRWTENGESTHDLAIGEGIWTLDQRSVAKLDQPGVPDWVDVHIARPILRSQAAPVLAESMLAEQPVEDVLGQLAEHRRVEVRLVAAMILAQLGKYDRLLLALQDPDQHWAWSDIYHSLQGALAGGPDTARQVKEACQRVYPQDSAAISELLVGYSPSMLRSGAAERLIQQLDSPQLSVRVLALENLQRITAGKTLGYRPHASERQRRQTVIAWSRRLDRGQIAYEPHQLPEAMHWLARADEQQL